jgi:hypothetical protein
MDTHMEMEKDIEMELIAYHGHHAELDKDIT